MSHEVNDTSENLVADATQELLLQLQAGSTQEKLMRLYALTELVGSVPPEMLLRMVSDYARYKVEDTKVAA
jgi:hypothetical protein